MSTERLNKSTDRVKESRRTMMDTEELGVSILHDLHQQRQSLLHANTTVCFFHFLFHSLKKKIKNFKFLFCKLQLHGVDDTIGRSKKLLTNMSRRMNRNKWILASIITILLLAVICILYFKLTR